MRNWRECLTSSLQNWTKKQEEISALPRNDDLVIRDFIILGMVFGILFWDIIFELYLPL